MKQQQQRMFIGDAVSPAGVIGYDFFANVTLMVDRVGGKVSFAKTEKEGMIR